MAAKQSRPTSPGRRHRSDLDLTATISKAEPEPSLLRGRVRQSAGRQKSGKVTIRHRGGGHKRRLRTIDFKREKRGMLATVMAIEYDPNRRAAIALLFYPDGEKRYILAPLGLGVGATVMAGEDAEVKVGNALPLEKIPVGTPIHNLELTPGKGGQLARGAGTAASIQSKEGSYATIQLPSKERRLVSLRCFATIGQVGNPEWRAVSLGKAGRRRHLGFRPHVRGVAMHPAAHPHGGGEGRSGIGMPSPKSPWGKSTLGRKTRKVRKYSDKFIVSDRRSP